jgi:anti-sigma B factor antagonist
MKEMNKFIIKESDGRNAKIIGIHGFLDAHTAPDLENKIDSLIKQGTKNIIVNFNDLDYISSAGLGVFMAFIEDIREKGGDIKLCSMSPKVFTVFDLLGFPILFDILENEELAEKKFNDNDKK